MKPNKQTIIATCALLIFLPEVMKAEELKGSFLQGIGDAFFGLLKSEAEKEQEERQRIISGFSGSDGESSFLTQADIVSQLSLNF